MSEIQSRQPANASDSNPGSIMSRTLAGSYVSAERDAKSGNQRQEWADPYDRNIHLETGLQRHRIRIGLLPEVPRLILYSPCIYLRVSRKTRKIKFGVVFPGEYARIF
jgi:hypothetical protein